MLRRKNKKSDQAQSLLEYTIVLGVVVTVIFGFSTLIQQGTQAMIRMVSDQLGNQLNSDQRFDDTGHLEKQYSLISQRVEKTTKEVGGNIFYFFNDLIVTDTKSYVNLGFQEEIH